LRKLATGWVVVVLSLHDDPASRVRALAAGATQVVSKHSPDDVLLSAIRAAAPGAQAGSAF
jgi:DNA-binding NarL/FixJ family response regulator